MNVKTLLMLFALSTLSCTKENSAATQTVSVNIIGVDPCTVGYPAGTPKKGYLLLLSVTKDTVVTYNLPVNVSKQIDANLKLQNNYLLTPDAIVTQQFTLRAATAEEKVFPLCNAMINTAGFGKYTNNQVMIE